MRVDRILIDLLDWIERVLSWKKDRKSAKPYEVLKQYRGKQGILKLVERDTPRAVRTYIFSPFPANQTNRMSPKRDVHLCLDHLWQIDGTTPKKKHGSRSRRWGAMTHRITVFEAYRFLNKDGTYDTQQIYMGEFDLLGNGYYRDQYAIPIVDDLAMMLKEFPADTIDWQIEIETGCKRHLGSRWRPRTEGAESPDASVAHPVVKGYLQP